MAARADVGVFGGSGFYEFLDPDPYVLTKEFAFFSNTVPDTGVDRRLRRDLFHLVYQRTAGPQAAETMFGHAWSRDLFHWVVDTAAFVVDTTRWNSAHVWAPSLVDYQGKVYMFYAGVDPTGDQSIGYASTSLLDTTDTVWDPARVQVWTARDTRWAVVDPPLYGSQTQFRDPFVIPDPDSTGRLLMFYVAHDSVDALLGRGGLSVGVARSEPGTVGSDHGLAHVRQELFQFGRAEMLHRLRALEKPGVTHAEDLADHACATTWSINTLTLSIAFSRTTAILSMDTA